MEDWNRCSMTNARIVWWSKKENVNEIYQLPIHDIKYTVRSVNFEKKKILQQAGIFAWYKVSVFDTSNKF